MALFPGQRYVITAANLTLVLHNFDTSFGVFAPLKEVMNCYCSLRVSDSHKDDTQVRLTAKKLYRFTAGPQVKQRILFPSTLRKRHFSGRMKKSLSMFKFESGMLLTGLGDGCWTSVCIRSVLGTRSRMR